MIFKNPEKRYPEIVTILKDIYRLPMVGILLKPALTAV
jgi:hypothetical protein